MFKASKLLLHRDEVDEAHSSQQIAVDQNEAGWNLVNERQHLVHNAIVAAIDSRRVVANLINRVAVVGEPTPVKLDQSVNMLWTSRYRWFDKGDSHSGFPA